jgi:FAD synthase
MPESPDRSERPLVVTSGVDGLRPDLGRLLVAVGVFDGLHRGHAYLLRALDRTARARHARAAVLTFDAHPDEIVRGAAPPLLLDPDERLVRLAGAGVEVVTVVHFDDALRRTPYDAFVESVRERVELAGFVMTPDAAFGYERRGTPETLGALGQAVDPAFDVVVVPPYLLDGRPVRSSEIRAAVADGRLDDARRLLGRRHAVTGTIAADESVSFPMPVALPPDGRYEVAIEPAWSVDSGPARAGWRGRAARTRRARVAAVAKGRLVLERGERRRVSLRRVRVAFGRKLPGA